MMASLTLVAFASLSPAIEVESSPRAADGKDAATITKEKAVLEETLFEPGNPPESIRAELGTHRGYASYDFGLHWNASSSTKTQKKVGNEIELSLVVDRMDAALGMKVVVYLPKDATKKLRDHEEGHRRISERIYEGADGEARRIVGSKIGKTFTGRGATPELAAKAARNVAGDEVLAEYKQAVQDVCRQVQARYDELTNHGMREDVQESDAIREAFKAVKVTPPTSKPVSKK